MNELVVIKLRDNKDNKNDDERSVWLRSFVIFFDSLSHHY